MCIIRKMNICKGRFCETCLITLSDEPVEVDDTFHNINNYLGFLQDKANQCSKMVKNAKILFLA